MYGRIRGVAYLLPGRCACRTVRVRFIRLRQHKAERRRCAQRELGIQEAHNESEFDTSLPILCDGENELCRQSTRMLGVCH
jgi:hypothetical protein